MYLNIIEKQFNLSCCVTKEHKTITILIKLTLNHTKFHQNTKTFKKGTPETSPEHQILQSANP